MEKRLYLIIYEWMGISIFGLEGNELVFGRLPGLFSLFLHLAEFEDFLLFTVFRGGNRGGRGFYVD
jgi:hypothetical protein